MSANLLLALFLRPPPPSRERNEERVRTQQNTMLYTWWDINETNRILRHFGNLLVWESVYIIYAEMSRLRFSPTGRDGTLRQCRSMSQSSTTGTGGNDGSKVPLNWHHRIPATGDLWPSDVLKSRCARKKCDEKNVEKKGHKTAHIKHPLHKHTDEIIYTFGLSFLQLQYDSRVHSMQCIQFPWRERATLVQRTQHLTPSGAKIFI